MKMYYIQTYRLLIGAARAGRAFKSPMLKTIVDLILKLVEMEMREEGI